MQETLTEQQQTKDLLKAVLIELFQENKEIITEVITEILEDIAMTKAIQEGENSEIVNRDEIFEILDA